MNNLEYYIVYYINGKRITSRNYLTKEEAIEKVDMLMKQQLFRPDKEPEIYEYRY